MAELTQICPASEVGMDSPNVSPVAGSIGAVVSGVNLSIPLHPLATLWIRRLLHKHRVVVFEGQQLDDAQLRSFAHRFGPPFRSGAHQPVLGGAENVPDIVVVGNAASDVGPNFLGHQEVLPHSDHQWLRCPSALSMLYAVDITEGSAATVWTDMVEACKLLDDRLRARIDGLHMITYNPFFRPFGSVCARYVDREEDMPPGEVFAHPLLRTHPETGECVLYLNAAYEVELQGVDQIAGKELMQKLWKHLASVECRYTHQWKRGDLVMWDNQATVHYRPAFDATVRRVLKRLTIGGGTPF